MCRLTAKVFETEDDFGDAVVIQPKGSSLIADYNNAAAIIRRTEDARGSAKWSFDKLEPGAVLSDEGNSNRGNPAYAVRTAHNTLGVGLENYDFIKVCYTDTNFPQNLLPR